MSIINLVYSFQTLLERGNVHRMTVLLVSKSCPLCYQVPPDPLSVNGALSDVCLSATLHAADGTAVD